MPAPRLISLHHRSIDGKYECQWRDNDKQPVSLIFNTPEEALNWPTQAGMERKPLFVTDAEQILTEVRPGQ